MSEMRCKKCDKQVDSLAKFCPHCGTALHQAAEGKSGKGGLPKSTRDTLLVIALVAVITAGFFMFKKPQPVPQQASQPVIGHGGDMGVDIADLPEDYGGLVVSGDKYMDQNNFAVAAECYKRALAIDGSSPDVRTDFGACLYGMGLAKRAIEEFQRVLETHPRHSIAIYNLGVVYYGLNAPDSARYFMKQYLEIEPNGRASENARKFLEELGT